MNHSIAELINRLKVDPWRQEVGFSEDILDVHDQIFGQAGTVTEVEAAIRGWLQRWQPCLFGRIAAKLGLITFCILSEEDLSGSDEEIHDKIQAKRLEWTREGFTGRRSAFVILAVSPRIAFAQPDETLLELANRLGFLYLEEPIKQDEIYLDQLFLEKPDSQHQTWRFYTGVNYFSAQGDKRWWNDHRIPGGLAFSINSVGHLVKAGQIARNLEAIKKDFGFTLDEEWIGTSVDSLEDALLMAMRTISLASNSCSGKATELVNLRENAQSLPKCPIELPGTLADKNHCEYSGFYHTDHTIPTVYFDQAIERPEQQPTYKLDFTYLFHRDLENPDHFTMGLGKQFRTDDESECESTEAEITRGRCDVVPIDLYEKRVGEI